MKLPKINKSARLAMNAKVYALITKDQGDQKEEVNNLLSLEKDNFEEEMKKRKNIKMNIINYLEKTKK
jgi:hypothetical protein